MLLARSSGSSLSVCVCGWRMNSRGVDGGKRRYVPVCMTGCGMLGSCGAC